MTRYVSSLRNGGYFSYGIGIGGGLRKDYPLPMRNTLVPQVGQVPCVAGLLFLSVTDWGFFISTFFLHFMQYACISAPPTFPAKQSNKHTGICQ